MLAAGCESPGRSRADFATPPIPLFASPSSVVSDVENTFIGLQLGARFHYQPSDRIEFLMGFKALAGNLNRDIQITDQNIFAGHMPFTWNSGNPQKSVRSGAAPRN